MNRYYIKLFIALFILLLVRQTTYSQVTINGPACVINTLQYQYIIGGVSAEDSSMSICLTGGTITDTDSSCQSGGPFSVIRVLWNNMPGEKNITLNSGNGNTVLNIALTSELEGGKIDSSFQLQNLDTSVIPQTIMCSPPKGGGCSSTYYYQWQQSLDNNDWEDIPNANNASLEFESPLLQNVYYRRKVSISNSVDYSDIAVIVVK